MNINSNGSDTPVKNVANAAEINIDLYADFLSESTFRNMAKAAPIKDAVDKIT